MSHFPVCIVYLIGQLGLGGSERQLYLLLKHMDKTRFEPHVVVFNPSPYYTLDDDLRKVGVKVYAIPNNVRSIYARMLWLYKLFRRIRPHMIHSWTIHDNPYAGLVGGLAGVPIRLGSVRDSLATPDFQQLSYPTRWLILNSVQSLLVNSNEIVEELLNFNIGSYRIQMLPNCVESAPIRPPSKITGFPENTRLVGMIANLRRKKNHILFLRGISKILSEFPDVYGVMVGQPVLDSDPDVPQKIEAEMSLLALHDRVRMIGFHSDIPSLLPNLYIFCLTSDFEGTPNVVLEAMAAGLPVIATRVGGIPGIIQDGISGLLVDPGDVHALAESLRRLLRNPERASSMGLAGRHRVETEFSCNVIVRRLEDYYLSQLAVRIDLFRLFTS